MGERVEVLNVECAYSMGRRMMNCHEGAEHFRSVRAE